MSLADIDTYTLVIALAVISGALVLGLIAVEIMRPNTKHRRLSTVVPSDLTVSGRGSDGRGSSDRRKKIDDTLKEMTKRQKAVGEAGTPSSLARRLRQAGLQWTRWTYIGVCVACGAVVFTVTTALAGLGELPALGFAIAAGGILPHLHIRRAIKKRFASYLAEFPDALDAITRGVKSGLPVGDCLRDIADNGREPLKSEFKRLLDDMALGLSLDEASDRMVKRTPILEVKLFTIILSIQNKAGGNLAEAIGNLSSVLRDRKRLAAKIKALSSEAVASAAIIGSLPIFVLAMLFFVAPDYVGTLFTTTLGNLALAAGGAWMFVGVIVMRAMVKIDV